MSYQRLTAEGQRGWTGKFTCSLFQRISFLSPGTWWGEQQAQWLQTRPQVLIPNCASQKHFNCVSKKPTQEYLTRKQNSVEHMARASRRHLRESNTVLWLALLILCSCPLHTQHSRITFSLHLHYSTLKQRTDTHTQHDLRGKGKLFSLRDFISFYLGPF